MGTLFIGSYYWPLNSPLAPLRKVKGDLVTFIGTEDNHAEALGLWEKILASIGRSPNDSSLWLCPHRLSPERLQLFSERVLWVFGPLLSSASIGAYRVSPWQSLHGIGTGWPAQPTAFVLPALSEMLREVEAKKLTWRWIKPLASSS